jgi:putative ABC transport system substrate-binding protein
MTNDNDPVAEGSVSSLARPGGNITGLSNLAPELSGKRLELLKEIVPKLSRLAVFGQTSNTGIAQMLQEIRPAAVAIGIELHYLEVQNSKDTESLFQDARKARVEALLVLPTAILNAQRPKVAELAAASRLPAIYPWPEYVEDGGLMSYSPNINDMFRRAATYVDKVLKGAKPADIPVEQPTKFELVINLKTAKALGLTIPQTLLLRADEVSQ